MKKIVNLTPHSISFIDENGNIIRIVETSGDVARLTTKTVVTGEYDGIPVTETEYGEITGLPDPTPDTIFVVSSLIAQRVPERDDVFIPNESVRDNAGRIIGCRSLGRIWLFFRGATYLHVAPLFFSLYIIFL